MVSASCHPQELKHKWFLVDLPAPFEQALQAAKPLLDDGVFQNHSNAAAEAHKIIRALDKNGPTVYALVALITTLDDLVIDARVDMTNILITMVNFQAGGKTVPSAAISMVNGLETAATANYDICELIGHATLRFVKAEETLIDQLTPKKP
jgi:hypothetical protein